MNKVIKNYITNSGVNLLYYCYNNEPSFPRNCGTISMLLALLLYSNKSITNKYKIYYIRGHYKDISEEKYSKCNDYVNITRSRYKCSKCINCTCDYMTAHSWVELIDKISKCNTIIDFTSCQFADRIGDLEQFLIDNSYLSKEELYFHISKISTIYISNKNKLFKNYIPDTKKISGKEIFTTTLTNYKNNNSTDILDALSKMGLLEVII